ncbi:MAG: 50S ribosomal protein L30e [Candidatus Diapherotrites archaeon]|nr:50S ribosomal protein L30e [Candidatus Diapherotrites archaeon]
MADFLKELRRAVDTGKVEFGSKNALKHSRAGDTKAIIFASSLPKTISEKLKHYCSLSNVLIYESEKTGFELGEVCGKPFTVGAISVQDTGHSQIVETLKSA